jgi:hypothetical protein
MGIHGIPIAITILLQSYLPMSSRPTVPVVLRTLKLEVIPVLLLRLRRQGVERRRIWDLSEELESVLPCWLVCSAWHYSPTLHSIPRARIVGLPRWPPVSLDPEHRTIRIMTKWLYISHLFLMDSTTYRFFSLAVKLLRPLFISSISRVRRSCPNFPRLYSSQPRFGTSHKAELHPITCSKQSLLILITRTFFFTNRTITNWDIFLVSTDCTYRHLLLSRNPLVRLLIRDDYVRTYVCMLSFL